MGFTLALVAVVSLAADAKADAEAPISKDAKAAKPAGPAVQCPAWIYFEPHFWSRHIADAPLATPVEVLGQTGSWEKVKVGAEAGFVPAAALTPPPGDAPGHESVEGYLTKEGLAPVSSWIIRYEGGATGARMRARLEDLRTFIRDGSLEAPK